jgi:glycosyl transferase family 2
VRYIATTKTRDFGHTQQNYALKHVRGDYLIYQDDDDIFLPRALTEAAKLATEQRHPHPIIGRIKTPRLGLLWQTPGHDAVLDGHCLVVPNDKRKLGWFNVDYSGDQCYIHTCLRNYKEVAWTDRIWTLARPHWKLWPQWSSEGNVSWACDLRRDDDGVPGDVVATVLLEADEERDIFYATLNDSPDLTYEEQLEIAEFLVYAGQSKDIWIRVHPSREDLIAALKAMQYKEHRTTKEYIELTHGWPPDFWGPPARFNHLADEKGNLIPDWRDEVWGGKAVDDE